MVYRQTNRQAKKEYASVIQSGESDMPTDLTMICSADDISNQVTCTVKPYIE